MLAFGIRQDKTYLSCSGCFSRNARDKSFHPQCRLKYLMNESHNLQRLMSLAKQLNGITPLKSVASCQLMTRTVKTRN